MSDNALYIYGIIKDADPRWRGKGINGKNVYIISEGNFNVFVHDCEEKPYSSEDPKRVKEWVISHNRVLNQAMKDFGGVIPLHFNTIIKKGEKNSEYNLKVWLGNEKEILEEIWSKIKGKKEYGIRIYYKKEKLLQEIFDNKEVKEIQKGKGKGLTYLLQGKEKDKSNEIAKNKINQSKQEFYKNIKNIVSNVKINTPRILIDEKEDLLLSLSILVKERQMLKTKYILKKTMGEDFSFKLVGPFAPYSFVENALRL